jgi:alanine dehydrogenase
MNTSSESLFSQLAKQAGLMTQEQLLAIKKQENSLQIGVPKETTFQENRVPLSPMAVQLLVQNGHKVKIESNAGVNANFENYEYSQVGGEIVYDAKSVFESDIVLKVAPPTNDEIDFLSKGQTLISAINIGKKKKEMIQRLLKKGVNAVGYEFLRNHEGALPIIRSMSEIAGRASVLIAAEYLSHYNNGKGELFGGIPGIQPTQMVIIGAGAVGEYATRAALGLGASVRVFDNSIYKLRRLEHSIGHRIHSSTIIPSVLASALAECDVAIGALRGDDYVSPCVVSDPMVQNMRKHALIIDVSIDQGGCFETSSVTNHKMPVFEKYDILHYCVPNIPSRFARTASYALSNIFTPLLLGIAQDGGFDNYLSRHEGLQFGTYIYKGNLTNFKLGEQYQLPAKELVFLLAGIHNK